MLIKTKWSELIAIVGIAFVVSSLGQMLVDLSPIFIFGAGLILAILGWFGIFLIDWK